MRWRLACAYGVRAALATRRADVDPPARSMNMRAITRDDEVEIAATLLGSVILGASFAKDFFMHGKFEVRVFFLGISCFVLFVVIALIAKIRIQVFDRRRLLPSLAWLVLFALGGPESPRVPPRAPSSHIPIS